MTTTQHDQTSEAATERLLIISADGHAGAPVRDYRDYVDPKYRDDFDDFIAGRAKALTDLFSEDTVEGFMNQSEVQTGGQSGAWDPHRRIKEIEADGIVADVLFPDGEYDNEPPFGAGLAGNGQFSPELERAGARAYNRWLAEFCSVYPERHAGVALVTIDDIDAAVAEIQWAANAGLKGGILVPSGTGDLPFYNDPRYEPIWAACEDLELPVNVHAASGGPDYGTAQESILLYATEVTWFGHRPFWFLLWGGVFERHPNLRFCLTEQTSGWIPDTLMMLDAIYEGPLFHAARSHLSLKPSEYWARQCYVGASFMAAHECERRRDIGLDKIMWGSDYPHVEGVWPHTRKALRKTFKGVAPDELRLMLGDNAARVYNFDLAALAPIAETVGPRPEEINA